MKRSPLKRKTPLRSVSDKRRAENKLREEARFAVVARSGGKCEAASLIARVDPVAASNCAGRGIEMHETKKRSRGGSIIDPENCVWICRSCHDWTEHRPTLATRCGLLVPSWA